jgi:hypothetical protein
MSHPTHVNYNNEPWAVICVFNGWALDKVTNQF